MPRRQELSLFNSLVISSIIRCIARHSSENSAPDIVEFVPFLLYTLHLFTFLRNLSIMIKKLFLLTIFTAALSFVNAQEFIASVRVNPPPSGAQSDPKVFQEMQVAIQNFLNNQRFTKDDFSLEERIKINIQINITGESLDGGGIVFNGDLQIQAVRPVFGSNYESILLSHKDGDVKFRYELLQPIEYRENSYADNLSAMLSFYAFYVLGLDYDSFSPQGGDTYFQTAQDIVSVVPQGVAKGWLASDGDRNRYWMAENMLSPKVKELREAWYSYHRRGLDIMADDVEAGKLALKAALDKIFKVNRAYPNSMAVQMFANAKSAEIIEIFKIAEATQKSEVERMMKTMDAARANDYKKIRG